MKVLITAGGTRVPIDQVRSITNSSKGKFGSCIADSFSVKGCDVIYFHAKEAAIPKDAMRTIGSNYYGVMFDTFNEYQSGLIELLLDQKPDIIVLAAAVSDYLVEGYVDGKIRTAGDMTIKLTPAPKIISSIRPICSAVTNYTPIICGFKMLVSAEDDLLEAECAKSLLTNKCDIVIGNNKPQGHMNAFGHRIIVTDRVGNGTEHGINFTAYTGSFEQLADRVADRCISKVKWDGQQHPANGQAIL